MLLAALAAGPACAWLTSGHQAVASVALGLTAGTRARAEITALLGGVTLEQASLWADCAKNVDPARAYRYTPSKWLPECAVFETPAGIAAMADYVRRNDRQCNPAPGQESCHKQYHYTNVSVLRDRYSRGDAGTSDHDVVAAIGAAIRMLRDGEAPAPFSFADRAEALRVLVHLVGDLHQPLHAGAIYLDAAGSQVDPDAAGDSRDSRTDGGNKILLPGERLHFHWDFVARGITDDLDGLARAAASVAPTAGDVSSWPEQWATESLRLARRAYAGIAISAKGGGAGATWPATLADGYDVEADAIKRDQIARAGARLAQIFGAVWPDR